ncbi:MAG TPA: type II CAAX endopeptidase family protein [Thermoanaerobaculia bacterium]|nr:type II CAAX endopeptidase family protein [Thermoanaerobaculia bacterium]
MTRDAPSPAGPLVLFFLIVFAITWSCFLAVAALPGLGLLRTLLLFAGVFAPAFVAIGLIAWAGGSSAVAALLRPLFHWQVGARWYLFATGYMAAIKLSVAVLHRGLTGEWPRFGTEPWYLLLAATLASTMIGGQAGEEIGWRGYALPRLAARVGFPAASVVLGLIWALWHLPLFFVSGADTRGQSFVVYVVQVTSISVAIAWLYVRTGGSLLLTMLMHSAINQTKDIVPSAVPGATNVFSPEASLVAWLTASLLAVCAIGFLPGMKERPLGSAATLPLPPATAP